MKLVLSSLLLGLELRIGREEEPAEPERGPGVISADLSVSTANPEPTWVDDPEARRGIGYTA